MAEPTDLDGLIDGAEVQPAVLELRPDYRVMLLAVDGLTSGARDPYTDTLLHRAEQVAAELLTEKAVEELPHIAAWREAYRAFGAKPQRTRNSLEALTRRAAAGLPRVNSLTDIYNAVSVRHQLPVGGEDLARYVGSPRLARATGEESFATVAVGDQVVEPPDVGEVVWCDDQAVTCRRWNWRQCSRTQLTDQTTTALFILDALAPVSDQALSAAAQDLIDNIARSHSGVRVVTRLIAP